MFHLFRKVHKQTLWGRYYIWWKLHRANVSTICSEKYTNKRRQAESNRRGKGGKGDRSKQGPTEIVAGSQVCLSTAPLYQVYQENWLNLASLMQQDRIEMRPPFKVVKCQNGFEEYIEYNYRYIMYKQKKVYTSQYFQSYVIQDKGGGAVA